MKSSEKRRIRTDFNERRKGGIGDMGLGGDARGQHGGVPLAFSLHTNSCRLEERPVRERCVRNEREKATTNRSKYWNESNAHVPAQNIKNRHKCG
jgi:hypothetical protein